MDQKVLGPPLGGSATPKRQQAPLLKFQKRSAPGKCTTSKLSSLPPPNFMGNLYHGVLEYASGAGRIDIEFWFLKKSSFVNNESILSMRQKFVAREKL